MTRTVSGILRLTAALLAPALVASAALADGSFVERYVTAVRLARAGRPDAALAQLEELAKGNPSSVPLHRAIARLALQLRVDGNWEDRFRDRLRRSSRDVGAAVGLALIEQARGRTGDARQLLLDSVTGGGRDPELVPLLLAVHPRSDELVGWLAARATVLPGDGRFGALRGRVLLALGRVAAAREVLERGLARDPDHPDLLALHADLLRAAGDSARACTEAAIVSSHLAGEQRVPEARVPTRVALARIHLACGQVDEARRLLRTAGPAMNFPEDPPLAPLVAVVEAEVALAREDPLGALAVLDEKGAPPEEDPVWGELTLAVRCRALAALAVPVPDARDVLRRAAPVGLALADRSAALAALAASPLLGDPELARALAESAERLAQNGLEPRASRARLLARWAGGASVEPEADAADVTGARALLDARDAARKKNPRGALDRASVERADVGSAPGALLAALDAVAARAALDVGEIERAAASVREGLLDVEAGNQGREPVPPEIEPIAGSGSDTALELAGLGFRAAIASRRPPGQAAEELLRNLGRVVRGWSSVEVPWPTTLADVARIVPADACLVVTTAGPEAPALAFDPRGAFAVAEPGDVLRSPPCTDRRQVLWAGPGPPPGGLLVAEGDPRVVVRLVVPAPLPRTGSKAKPPPALGIGPGTARPLRDLVEALNGTGEDPGARRVARFDETLNWPVFRGAGLAPSTSPLSSGWLAPLSGHTPAGWIAPETLLTMPVTPGAGLVAVGLKVLPNRGEPERGMWLLAESALGGGWQWALLSRRPLEREEYGRIEQRLRYWSRDPVREARRLVEDDPGLANALALWTAPVATEVSDRSAWLAAAGVGLIAVVAAVAVVRRAIVNRRALAAQAVRSSSPPGPPAPA